MTINSKNTKAEILAAYKALEKENQSLQTNFARSKTNQQNNNASSSAKSIKLETAKTIVSPQIVQEDIIKTIKYLDDLQRGFGSSVSHLSAQLIAEATTLAEIKNLIHEEQEQLKELHDLSTIEEDTINSLLKQYQTSHEAFAEEFELESESKNQEIAKLVQTWEKEKELHDREIKIKKEERKKAKQRSTEEYQYQLDLARDIDEENYEQSKQSKYQELAAHRQELEEQWQAKEQAIAQTEQQYQEAQQQIIEFEEKLRKKVKQGEEEGKAIGTYQAKIKQDLRKKEIAGEQQNYRLKVEALQETIDNQEARIVKLTQQLDAAQHQVQELAVKAIEGSANRQSYEAMKEIALEQAKTQQKGK